MVRIKKLKKLVKSQQTQMITSWVMQKSDFHIGWVMQKSVFHMDHVEVWFLVIIAMAKWSRASCQSSGGWERLRSVFFLSNFSNLFKFSAIFVLVPFFEYLWIWSSFLSILLSIKYLQPNFKVSGCFEVS